MGKRAFIVSVLCFVLLLCGVLKANAGSCTVNVLTDTGAGANFNGDLRYCINLENSNPGADYIFVNVSGAVMLQSPLPPINDSLQIYGSGQTSFIIDGANITGSTFASLHPFEITSSAQTVGFSKLTIRNGNSGANSGGAILINGNGSNSTVNLTNVTLSDNTSQRGGGAIDSYNANINIVNSLITRNKTDISYAHPDGGGINFTSSETLPHQTLFITGTTISDNRALHGDGGGISASGDVKIENSTFSGNVAEEGRGGGLFTTFSTLLRMSNATISNNQAFGSGRADKKGGGIYADGTFDLRNCTIAGNSAATAGGGIYYSPSTRSQSSIANLIVADNAAPDSPDTSSANHIIKRGSNIFKTAPTGVYDGSGTITVADPRLNALADNGGLTQTRSLQPTSPAINAGVNSEALNVNQNALTYDQRGAPRVIGAAVDLGAFETGADAFVTNENDTGAGSLRAAINNVPAGGTIVFDRTYFNQIRRIYINSTIDVPKNLTVIGPGSSLVLIDAGYANVRVLNIGGNLTVNISGLAFAGGKASGNSSGGGILVGSGSTLNAWDIYVGNCHADNHGGGIYAVGNVNLTDSSVNSNDSNDGGGIFVENGSLATLLRSTVSGNRANGGGGIYGRVNATAAAIVFNTAAEGAGILVKGFSIINNSTVSDNEATTGKGGAAYIQSGNQLDTTNTTITENVSDANLTGGIYNEGLYQTRNSIIAGNHNRNNAGAQDISGALTSYGYNLVGDTTGANIVSSGVNGQTLTGNILNQAANLAPLYPYGGTTYTHALLQNSPAIDAGDTNNFFTTDQRGSLRPIGNRADIGSFERNVVFDQASLPNGSIGGNYNQTLTAARQNSFAESDLAERQPANVSGSFTFSIVYSDDEHLPPPGLTLDSSGTISGTPTKAGIFTFIVAATDADGMAGVQQYTIRILAPTAASVSVSGRVMTSTGRGISNVMVRMTDANGTVRVALSTSLGYYSFTNVAAGETYVFTVKGKRFEFAQPTQVLNINEETNNINFTAAPQ